MNYKCPDCGWEYKNVPYPVVCSCSRKCKVKAPPVACPHRIANTCELASYLAGEAREVDDATCHACIHTSSPRDINEVTKALAGIKNTEELPHGGGKDGPGTRLAKVISWFIPHGPCQACSNRIDVMNAWGYERCRKEIPTILDWLRDSAHRNGYRYNEFVVAALVRLILRQG